MVPGRRSGRPLRPALRALLDERLPSLAVALPDPGTDPGGGLDPTELFPFAPRRIWLEIGFGAGEHLAAQAERNPDVGLLGAEVFRQGVAKLLREIARRGLDNIRIHLGDGQDLLAAMPPSSLERVFILFPDPWHKARHHKRRLIRRETLDRLAEVMQPGGELRIATDHPGYVDWIVDCLSGHPAFAWTARRPADWRARPDDWPETRYERKALAAQRRPTYLRYIRRP